MGDLLADVRYATRALLARRSFAAAPFSPWALVSA